MRSLYNYPRLLILILMLILVAGSSALFTMPRLEDPHMRNRVVFVITHFPGASAERVEALVTEKLERKIREVSEVKDITSSSRLGLSFITIEMKDDITNVDRVSSLLRDKISEVADLPDGAGTPIFDDKRLYAFTAMIGLTWQQDITPNYAILGRHAKELDLRLGNITGTDFVRVYGLPAEEISVTLDHDILGAIGMTAADVAARIFAGDSKSSSGAVSGDHNRYVVEVDGALDSLERIRSIPLRTSADFGIATVGDIAHVERTHSDPADQLAYLTGHYGVVIAARMLENRRVDQWMDQVISTLDAYRTSLPENIHAEIIFDQAQYTESRLSGLMENLIVGAIIVTITLLITLGWKASFVAGSILPLAALSALAVLNLFGLQIEQMVVAGLIVALGIMVDNAIVVTDDVQTRLLHGERRSQAVARTIKRLWLPLLGSTATTIIAFMPIILMSGNAGEFVGGISASVIAALASSYLISFTLIVAIAGRVLGRQKAPPLDLDPETIERRWWREGVDAKPIRKMFRQSLHWSIKNPRLSMLLASLLPALGFVAGSTLTEQFFPNSDRNQFHIELSLPKQASIEETRRLVEDVHQRLIAEEDVVSADWFIGQSAPKFYYNLLSNQDGVAHYAQGMITTTNENVIDGLISRYQTELDRAYPQVQTLVRILEQGPPYDAPVEVRIHGPDLETLRDLGEQIRRILTTVPSVIHSRTSLEVGRPEIRVRADERAASTLGLDLRSVAYQLRSAIDGTIAGSLIESTEDVPVRVRTERSSTRDIEGLRTLELIPPIKARLSDGSFTSVPLSALAQVYIAPSVGNIPRRNSERVNTVQGFIPPDVLPETALAQFNEKLKQADVHIPPGYRIDFGGESEERNEAVGKLMAQAGVLGILMIIAIVLTFNSFRLAGITFGSAVQAAGLGLLSIWAFGHPLGFVVIMGLMGLVGLAINASIVILSQLKNDPAARSGDHDAIVHGVMSTGRHITSTTLTTVGGFMPLVLSSSPIWPPFAVAIAGGTLMTMLVSFYFAPAAFSLLMKDRTPIAAPPDKRLRPGPLELLSANK